MSYKPWLALATVVVLLPVNASAYVRSRRSCKDDQKNCERTPLSWRVSCIPIETDPMAARDVDPAVFEQAVDRAIANWNDKIASCTYLRLFRTPASAPVTFAKDRRSVILFRQDPDDERFQSLMGAPPAISNRTLGLTTVHNVADYPDDSGIFEADMELNAVDNRFVLDGNGVSTPNDPRIPVNLEAVLTHEIGHVLGFTHSCDGGTDKPPPLDNDGNPLQSCSDPALPTQARTSVMFPNYTGLAMTNVSDDDALGVCELYPSNRPPPACFLTVQGGCSTAPGAPPRGAAALLLLAFALLSIARRQARAP